MKVSFFETARDCAPEPLPQEWPVPSGAYDRDAGAEAYRSTIERLQYVEDLGFDWVSVSEHHIRRRDVGAGAGAPGTGAMPTLVLFGPRDGVASPVIGRVYKALIPNSHLVFVYDAAHAISTDRPEAFAEIVVDFLERHEAFVISRTPAVIHP